MSFKETELKLKKLIANYESKATMGAISKEVARLIKLRTRTSGKDENDIALKVLATSTIKQKKRLGRKLPSKSRLTDTGEMLDDIAGKGLRSKTGIVYFNSKRSADIAGYNEDKGRKFFAISNKDELKLSNFIVTLYRKITGTSV